MDGDRQQDSGPLTRYLPGPDPTIGAQTNLVVGWTRDRSSLAALRFAVDLAWRLVAHVHVVHVVDLDDMPLDPDAPDWERQFADTVNAEALAAREILADLPTSWSYHSGHGSATTLLASVADRYESLMVVVGSPRAGFISHVESLLGESVAHRLIGQRAVPVLVVPADNEPPAPTSA